MQRKFIQLVKDTFEKDKDSKEGYLFARETKHPKLGDKQVFHVLANTISKEVGGMVLADINSDEEQPLTAEKEEQSYVVEFERIKCNQYSLNERLNHDKRIVDNVVELPAKETLEYLIKFKQPSDIKTVGIQFGDGNTCSYKFNLMFMDENGKILSELTNQRSHKVTNLMEFYELENKVIGANRATLTILDKYNEHDVHDNVINIKNFLLTNDILDHGLVQANIASLKQVENKASEFNYLNHPSLLKLRIATNQVNYPMLYELSDSVSFDISKDDYSKYLRIYNPHKGKIINSKKGEPIGISIRNPNTSKYEDNVVNTLSTLVKKGHMKYGGYKNRFIAFKIIPMKFDEDSWSIDFVTRGGDIENTNNLFNAVVQIHKEGFSFNRIIVQEKPDVFIDELPPRFDIKLKQDEELDIIFYQFNINETDVQYYIYTKSANDDEWQIYQAFIDSDRLKGENYGGQTISWGGLYDYIFFNGITKMELLDLTLGELREPIRKIE
ncbi:MAG: hypothetical protein R2685_10620 [Candidatus Nitrosocosmicus sp.]|nr:hypothetical protein [Candidatus Nitrosocosmicus sp.]